MVLRVGKYDFIVDDELYDDLSRYNWHIQNSYGKIYARLCHKGEYIFLHRMILKLKNTDHLECDHINCDTLDCRRKNLRVVTHAQNMLNKKIYKNNKCGFKGVYKSEGKYRARIRLNGKIQSLGYYDTPELAHAAYCEASKKYHGEFGRTE